MSDRLEWFEQQFRAGVYTEADDDLRWLVNEVRRLREELAAVDDQRANLGLTLTLREADLAEERQEHQATLQMAADLRQRHAEAVEKAYREGFNYAAWHGDNHRLDMGWEQSEARKGVERDCE